MNINNNEKGFLWDEGFHQLIIGRYDPKLSIEIITSWLNTMDDNGWIAREQIVGEEARSRVPEAFQVQMPHIANPPTMFLAIHALHHHWVTKFRQLAHCSNDQVQVAVDSAGDQTKDVSTDENCLHYAQVVEYYEAG
ncbi:hypothetical protein RFI_11786 [Reticulomyxa filosa]|uniref:mannosyl-oligosaccharide glucosidase n=1 Tax=Reticulomyxa filosa TaxID=46433 RepID=X6NHI2_RETFI|nr:hypothetical protein RFI_11786 [Reticulomyxa filosa]|eukprot:ETO25348.1 hypothetical protein RFI_11786 [Reticulomyxa filosa]